MNIEDTTGFGEEQFVMRQGDPFQGTHTQMYFVLHGQFRIVIAGIPVRIVGPGEHFGELALFTKGPRTASVQCLTA